MTKTENSRVDIFWLDDDISKLRVVVDLLEFGGMGWSCQHADSVVRAVIALREMRFVPVLLLDAIMPIGDLRMLSENELGLLNSIEVWSNRDQETPGLPHVHDKGEYSGLAFLKLCEALGISFGQTVIISYVAEEALCALGYRFDAYISKLALPDELAHLQSLIKQALTTG